MAAEVAFKPLSEVVKFVTTRSGSMRFEDSSLFTRAATPVRVLHSRPGVVAKIGDVALGDKSLGEAVVGDPTLLIL